MTIDVAALIGPVDEIAAAAAARIMAIYTTTFNVAQKGDNSPLTAADLDSHKTIVEGLQRLTPDIPILSEESATAPFAERVHWERFWLVDPLDGTKEFIKRNGEFTVNIALIEGHEPVLGVVQIPAKQLCYFAAQGHGAFRQRVGEAVQRISVRPLGDGPISVVGSRSHGGPSLKAFVSRLGEHTFVAAGSSLKFCWVAEGRADIYPRLGPTWEWDTAAAQCIVEEAGGRVIATTGERLAYNKPSLLNPHFLVMGDASRDWLSYVPSNEENHAS